MMTPTQTPRKIVLAYSGGLDTSVILPWLKDRYPGVSLVAYAADLGQGAGELDGIEEKALASGADEVIVDDLRQEFAEAFCFAMLRTGAIYENEYLLGTSIARPLIAEGQVRAARASGADAVSHGATGKGNDQVRFELGYMAKGPDLAIIAPWKDPTFELSSREAAIDYAENKGVPIFQNKKKIYSRDRNLWHCSHEGAEIEDPTRDAPDDVWLMSVPLSQTPDHAEELTLTFERGTPVALDGVRMAGHDMIETLNDRAGKHAVGQILIVENRLVGMKSRGAYETPGGTVLYNAHNALRQITLERETLQYLQQASAQYASLVYNGQWFHPLREAMQAMFDHAERHVSGNVTMCLEKGHARATGVTSDQTLYDPQLASFAMDGFDVTAARGFIDLFGLPMKVAAMRDERADA